jgi:hypothetical protein
MTLEPKDLITLIGLLVSLIVGFSSLYISFKNSKKTIFINSVTASRAKWIDTIRNTIADYCGYSMQIFSSKTEEKLKLVHELQNIKYLIKLQLNRNDRFDALIIKSIDKIASHFYDDNPAEINQEINELILLTQDLLKLEWEGVKEESKKGNLTKREKRKLYNRYLNHRIENDDQQ